MIVICGLQRSVLGHYSRVDFRDVFKILQSFTLALSITEVLALFPYYVMFPNKGRCWD